MPNPTDSTNPLTDARGGQGILLSASDPGVLVQVRLRTPSGRWRYRDWLRPVDRRRKPVDDALEGKA
jgi:hypothetical protein